VGLPAPSLLAAPHGAIDALTLVNALASRHASWVCRCPHRPHPPRLVGLPTALVAAFMTDLLLAMYAKSKASELVSNAVDALGPRRLG